MSDNICVGTITKLESGRFENQYDVEITMPNGQKFTGADGISVYKKKKDGSDAKVWPLVQQSFLQEVPFAWTGNVKESDTKAGLKTYATLTWATTVDEIFEDTKPASSGNGSGGDWGEPVHEGGEAENSREKPVTSSPTAAPAWEAAKAKLAGETQGLSKEDYWDRRERLDEDRQRQIVASWAITNAIALGRNDLHGIHELAHELILAKEQIASELRK